MSKKLRSEFQKETGKSPSDWEMNSPIYHPKYVEWLEQRIEAGQHETIVMCELNMTVKVNRNGIFKYLERNGFLKPKKEMIAINLDTLSVMGSSENPPATYRHLRINKLAT